ncbi:MAG: hypothetical protein ACR2HW_08680 [Gemmatimonadales bacterium]
MIVAKFGGTSVADAEAIGRLLEIIRSRTACRPIVVVSALAKVTDALLALAQLCGPGDGTAIDAAVAALLERHEGIAAKGRRLSAAELDAVAGRGELWSSRLVAAAMVGAGLAADWVDIRAILVTDGRFGPESPS